MHLPPDGYVYVRLTAEEECRIITKHPITRVLEAIRESHKRDEFTEEDLLLNNDLSSFAAKSLWAIAKTEAARLLRSRHRPEVPVSLLIYGFVFQSWEPKPEEAIPALRAIKEGRSEREVWNEILELVDWKEVIHEDIDTTRTEERSHVRISPVSQQSHEMKHKITTDQGEATKKAEPAESTQRSTMTTVKPPKGTATIMPLRFSSLPSSKDPVSEEQGRIVSCRAGPQRFGGEPHDTDPSPSHPIFQTTRQTVPLRSAMTDAPAASSISITRRSSSNARAHALDERPDVPADLDRRGTELRERHPFRPHTFIMPTAPPSSPSKPSATRKATRSASTKSKPIILRYPFPTNFVKDRKAPTKAELLAGGMNRLDIAHYSERTWTADWWKGLAVNVRGKQVERPCSRCSKDQLDKVLKVCKVYTDTDVDHEGSGRKEEACGNCLFNGLKCSFVEGI